MVVCITLMQIYATISLLVSALANDGLGQTQSSHTGDFKMQTPLSHQVPFPDALYQKLPEDVLDDALNYLLGGTTSMRTLRDNMNKNGYNSEETDEIQKIISELQNANFFHGLLNLRNDAIETLSEQGRHVYCYLLFNMPSTYKTPGFQYLTDILTRVCPESSSREFDGITPRAAGDIPPGLSCRELSEIRKVTVTARIIGGIEAKLGAFPSFASLYAEFIPRERGVFIPGCGATIIDSCTLVTAAHCIVERGFRPEDITVQVGDHTTVNSTTSVSISRIFTHEGFRRYSTGELVNDIAILKVDNVNFGTTPFTAPAALATRDLVLQGRTCTVVGIGITSRGDQPVDCLLQQVTVPVYDGFDCSRNRRTPLSLPDPQNQLCGGDLGRDACTGDSGGPLYCEQNGQQVLTGIVSYGYGNCGSADPNGIYVNVASYTDWIRARSGCWN